jgi:membrane-associated phospholipid phosphatase
VRVTSAILPRVETYTRRAASFLRRHKWSVPLFISSSISLLYLGHEMREGDLVGIDTAIGDVVHGWRGSMDELMFGLTTLGGGGGMAVLSVFVMLALASFGKRREATFMFLASFGTLLISTGLKLLFHRARPVDVGYLIPEPSSFSFPSGHALGSMGVPASCVVVLYALRAPRALRVLGATLGAAFAFGVALSRVYFGVHFPSDVLGGQLAAAAWVSALTGWFYPRLFPGERSLHPAPEA